jgi:hypothetical protein
MRRRRVKVIIPTTRLGRMKAQAMRATDVVVPLASDARDVAAHRIEDARYWAAPRLDRAAHSVEKQLAPKVSGFLSDAAKVVEPGPVVRMRRRWPMFALFAGLALGAAGFMMYRNNRQWADSLKESSADAGRWVADKTSDATHKVGDKAEDATDKVQAKSQKMP